MNSNFGFIISTYVCNDTHKYALIKCILSIYNFHPDCKIVVIIDHKSDLNFFRDILNIFSNVLFEFDCSNFNAENLPYLYFLKKKYFQKAVILQDSMFLVKKLENISSINTCKFIWHFENNRNEWAVIKEPETTFNITNNIVTHDDLNKYNIKNKIINEEFKKYCLEIYDDKFKWIGCFGCRLIIDYNFLVQLEEKTNIIDLLSKLNEKRDRMSAESIFGLACQFAMGTPIIDSYDGLHWDGTGNGYRCDGNYIKKLSFSR